MEDLSVRETNEEVVELGGDDLNTAGDEPPMKKPRGGSDP